MYCSPVGVRRTGGPRFRAFLANFLIGAWVCFGYCVPIGAQAAGRRKAACIKNRQTATAGFTENFPAGSIPSSRYFSHQGLGAGFAWGSGAAWGWAAGAGAACGGAGKSLAGTPLMSQP